MTETCYVCDAPAQVLAPPVTSGAPPRPMCSKHYAAELQAGGPRGACRATACTKHAYGPHYLCQYHRGDARRLGLSLDAPSELFVPREIQVGARPSDETIAVHLSAYAAHIIRLVGKPKRRTIEDQSAAILEEWAGYNRPRG